MDKTLSLTDSILEAFMALSGWETLAAFLGTLYVILAARESVWCWPAAFVSTLIYTLLFWEGQLPMQSMLNLYYMAMAVYGFSLWRHHAKQSEDLFISTRSIHFHIGFILIGGLLTWITSIYLENVMQSRLPLLDAAVTVFSVMNTVLMARKILENWLYWLAIDVATIWLYWETGYYVTIVMFTVYLIIAVSGFLNWQKLYKARLAAL